MLRQLVQPLGPLLATYAGGYAVWLLYGLCIGSLPLILVDVLERGDLQRPGGPRE